MTDLFDVSGVDVTVPNAARMYDFFLGGSHNFAADRAAAERVREAMPWIVDAVWANRAFLGRAVRYCLAQGIDQFLDLGSGIPTVGSVHEIARATDPRARVCYVDDEPVAVICAEAILDDDPLATITRADMRDPDAVFAAPGVADLLDLSRPVGLLTVAVLHFVPDSGEPAALAERYRRRLAPGSVHVLSHVTADHDPELAAAAVAAYRNTANPVYTRPAAEIAAMFGDAALVEPGLVDATAWRPDASGEAGHVGFYAGVARIGG